MEVKEAIEKRRSIRRYQDKEISQKIIDELIEAARLAPSAYNAQPWRFRVVKDKKIIEELKDEKVFKNEFVYTSPLIMVCCGDEKVYPERAKDNFDLKDLVLVDVSIATQNLVLRATELGIGCCYIGLFDKDKIKEILGIDKNLIIPYVIVLGYADEKPDTKPRKSKEEILL